MSHTLNPQPTSTDSTLATPFLPSEGEEEREKMKDGQRERERD